VGLRQLSLSHAPQPTIIKINPADHKNQKKNKSLEVHFKRKSNLESKPYYDPITNENLKLDKRQKQIIIAPSQLYHLSSSSLS
jgi:hypothetical protein